MQSGPSSCEYREAMLLPGLHVCSQCVSWLRWLYRSAVSVDRFAKLTFTTARGGPQLTLHVQALLIVIDVYFLLR